MKTLLTATAIIALTLSTAYAAYCEKRIKCDSNGCHEIIDCR